MNDLRETASLVSGLSALIIAATYSACRIGFQENTPGPVLSTLGLSWFVLNCPFVVKRLWADVRTSSSWMASDGTLILAGLVFVVSLGWLAGSYAGLPVAACGVVFFAWRLLESLSKRGFRGLLESLFWGSAFGICLSCWIWGDDLHDPLFRWALLTKESWNGKVDELIHTCWSNMIRTYGIPSSGLDGIPFYRYHFGSHIIFASFGELIGIPGIDVYQMVYPVVFLPLLLQSTVIAAVSFASNRPGRQMCRHHPVLLWPIIIIGFAGVLPYSAVASAGYFVMSDLSSESMCVALTVMLLGIAATAPLVRRVAEDEPSTIRRLDSAMGMLGFPALIFVLGFLKYSVMAICLAASTLVFLMVRRFRKDWACAIALGAAYIALYIVSLTVLEPLRQREASAFFPLAYMRVWVDISWWSYYIFLEVAVTFVAISLRLWQEDVTSIAGLIGAWRAGRLVDVGFAFFATCFSVVPGFIYDIQGASASYFTHVQRWISLPILLSVLLSLPSDRGQLCWRERVLAVPLWKIGTWLFLIPSIGTIALNTTRNALIFARNNLSDRGFQVSSDAGDTRAGTRSSIKREVRQGRLARVLDMIRQKAQEQQRRSDAEAVTIRILTDLFALPREEKRQSLLYIPRSNRAFWDLLDENKPRWLAPLVGPALSGMAMIDGLPDPQDIPANGLNGYSSYGQARSIRLPSDRTKGALCRRADQMGFRRIFALSASAESAPHLEEWCFGGSRSLLDEDGKPLGVTRPNSMSATVDY